MREYLNYGRCTNFIFTIVIVQIFKQTIKVFQFVANCTCLVYLRNGTGTRDSQRALTSQLDEVLISITALQSSGSRRVTETEAEQEPQKQQFAIDRGSLWSRARAPFALQLALSLSFLLFPPPSRTQIYLPIVFRSLLITSCVVAAHSGSTEKRSLYSFQLIKFSLYNIIKGNWISCSC